MAINHKDRMYSIKSSIAEWKLRGSSDEGSLLAIDDMEWLIEQLELSRRTKADEAKRVTKLLEALNWIGAIAVAPKESWPTQEVCAEVANEALRAYERGDV